MVSFFSFLPLSAQFFTITPDTARHSRRAVNVREVTPKEDEPPMENPKSDERNQGEEEVFSTSARGHEIAIERDVPVFVNVKDSMMKELLHDRLNVCLPLDFLKVNSNYGYRTDPIFHCTRFHDGIDLNCHYANV